RFDSRTRTTLAVLESMPLPIVAAGLSRRVFIGAGAALLPEWGRRLIGRGQRQRTLGRAAAAGLYHAGPMIRAAMSEGVARRSARRVGAPPACLEFGR